MEQAGANLSPDRSLASEQEGVSRRNLLTHAVPALAAASMIGPSRAEAAVPPGGSRLDVILKAGKIRVGTFLQYKPYTFKNPAGEADGWDRHHRTERHDRQTGQHQGGQPGNSETVRQVAEGGGP